jgi:hypothetical protein
VYVYEKIYTKIQSANIQDTVRIYKQESLNI